MKKLMLLSLAIISSNAFSYSNLEEQLCTAVNNCDVKKTQDLINKIGEMDQEFKTFLFQTSKNNILYYQTASKDIFKSPRDLAYLSLSILGGSYGIKFIEKTIFAINHDFRNKAFNKKHLPQRSETLLGDDFSSLAPKRFSLQEMILGIVLTSIAAKQIDKYLDCPTASNKLNQAQAVYSLVSEIKVKNEETKLS